MPVGTSGTITGRQLQLGQALKEYSLKANYIADQVAPIFNVKEQAASFPAIVRNSATKAINNTHVAGADYQKAKLTIKNIGYATTNQALEADVFDRDAAKYESDFALEQGLLEITLEQQRIAREIRMKNALFNTTTFTGAALYHDWSAAPWDAAASDAIAHVRAAIQAIQLASGLIANGLVIGKPTMDNLLGNTGIKAAITNMRELTPVEIRGRLATILDLQYVFVGDAAYDSADEGQAFSGAYVWGDDYAFVGVFDPTAGPGDITKPMIARSPLWLYDGYDRLTPRRYRNAKDDGWTLRLHEDIQEKILDTAYGFLMKVDA